MSYPYLERIAPVVRTLLISLASIALSLVVAAIIMLLSGYDPLLAYSAMLSGAFGSTASIASTLAKSVPLMFTGLSCAVAYKGGLFNIGGEGQLYMGALAATLVALGLGGVVPPVVLIALAVLAGMAAGGLVGAATGFLKARMHLHEVIVAIMLNYIVRFFTSYLLNGSLREDGSMIAQSPSFGQENMMTALIPKTQLTTAFILAIIAAVVVYFIFRFTRFGYEIRTVGENIEASRAAGVNVWLTSIVSMGLAGAMSGLCGVTEVLGKSGKFIDGFSPGYGFTGIAVAFLGNNNPLGVVAASLLFGIIDAGSTKMSYVAGVYTSMIGVIQGLVILFVSTPSLVTFWKKRRVK